MANLATAATNATMNTHTTSTEGVSILLKEVLNRTILKAAKEKNVFNQFGQSVKIPKGKTKVLSFDRAQPLDVSTTALTEGVTPAGDKLTLERITATPMQYGHYIAVTDEFDFFKHDPSPELLKKTELLADQMASTFDLLTLNVLKSGTNVQYAGGKKSIAEIAATDKITVQEVMKAVRTLKANKAEPISGNDYVCIIDPYLAYDLMGDDRWQKVKEYDPSDMYKGEIGKLFGVRFVDTTQNMELEESEKEGNSAKLHRAFFFGKNAYGSTNNKGNCETIVQPATDPLHQVSTIGWKGHHVAKILTNEWMVEFIGAVSE